MYLAICSVDGYVEDASGSFEWAAPDEEVHAFANDLTRSVDTHLYGRRMYEVMSYWEDPPGDSDPVELEYAQVWQAADKVVYSRTLEDVSSSRTRLEREFDPRAVAQLKASAERDLSIGGPELAAHGFRAGLIDECHLFLSPVVVGGGNKAMPDGVRVQFELLDERRFGNGVVHLHYRAV